MTFWGENADAQEVSSLAPGDILSLKSVRVGEFQGKTLSYSFNSQMVVNDFGHPVPSTLHQWWIQTGQALYQEHLAKDTPSTPNPIFDRVYGEGGKEAALHGSQSLAAAPRVTLQHVLESDIGTVPGRDDFFSVVATAMFSFQNNITFLGCPYERCNRKLTPQGCPEHGNWYIEEGKEPVVRYLINVCISDFTGSTYVNMFNNTAEVFIGRPAKEIHELKTENEEEFQRVLAERCFLPYLMRIRVRPDTYNDRVSKRFTCVAIEPLDYPAENSRLIQNILEYLDEGTKVQYGLSNLSVSTPPVSQHQSGGAFAQQNSFGQGQFNNPGIFQPP